MASTKRRYKEKKIYRKQRVVFTGETKRQKKSGQNATSRKRQCPRLPFQFGVKMQDGHKTRKQNRDQKLNNELHKINKILARRKRVVKMMGTTTMTY